MFNYRNYVGDSDVSSICIAVVPWGNCGFCCVFEVISTYNYLL